MHREEYLVQSEWTEYFANAPPAFKPRKLVKDQDLNNTISDKDCQLCFKEAKASGDIKRCQVCCRVAHQQCHDIYRTRKGACEGNTGCPLCCPHCPWNPSNREPKAEPLSLATKEEPGLPGVKSEIIDDIPWTTMAKKNQMLEKKVRKLRGQLRGQCRRKQTSRTMTDRQYKRLVAKTGGRVANYRDNKGTMCKKNAPKKEEACVKEERKAHIFQERTTPVKQTVKEERCVKMEEESEPAVVIVKVEPRRKVKS
ncbi:hypothetical protein B0H65DRAFT_435100 [Neurospora tetraspora]|uniref:Uncharacterized protein n=1 Tax=Neurospora tetraspora TaxID=94610 RepID=A0AAE0J8H6_9PEZI|nr:hypothetical protein B0H65DRAFT_435100 [Neurospora tetraspora]